MLNSTDGDSILSFLGRALIVLAILTSAHQIARPHRGGIRIVKHTVLAAQIAPILLLLTAFIIDASSLKLVAIYGDSELPFLYKISAAWAGRAGPLLLFAGLSGLVTWLMIGTSEKIGCEIRLMNGFILGLFAISWFLDPFADSTGVFPGELNPLLQTDLMVIHPPIVFLFYSFCIATAAAALGGILEDKSAVKIHESQLHWARAAFVTGTIGIGLGGLWAYTVLDWGGYWAWDPVETGSILPWFALLLIIHARSTANSNASIRASPALGLIAGALAIHATLITRANGVWASVHAFVADGLGTTSEDPYVRIAYLVDASPIGFELASYLFVMLALGGFAVFYLVREQTRFVENDGGVTLFEANRPLSLGLFSAFIAVGIWIDSSAVFAVGTSLMLLIITADSEKPPLHWMAAGVLLMLFASWTWVAEIPQAIAGMIPFLATWLMSDDEDDLNRIFSPFTSTSARTKFARIIPWYGAGAFLLLTWLLLTVEIEGTNLEAHEFYASPLLALLAIGLTFYGWANQIDSKTGSIIIACATFSSLVLAYYSANFEIPGDSHLMLTDRISRGSIALFLLTWMFLAIPPTIQQAYKTWKKTVPKLKQNGIKTKSNVARLRLLGSHLSHLGILLLLIGHIFTTTLVDRSDPSHLVTLTRNQVIEHNGIEFVFTEVELISAEDEGFDFKVGDGYLGVIIEMRRDGELIDTLRPGMLRFDSPSGAVSARSEVDRHTGIFGDTIIILDIFQSNQLLDAVMLQQTDDIDRVRVTIHDLQGSHAVWTGWGFIMLGGILAFISSRPSHSDEEE